VVLFVVVVDVVPVVVDVEDGFFLFALPDEERAHHNPP
jgi:hypothetical protein